MNEKIKKIYQKYDIWIMFSVLITVFLIMSLLQPVEENSIHYNQSLDNRSGCTLEYSDSRCQDGEILTLFHNPSNVPVREVELIISDGQGGKNIYRPGSPLPVNETSYLNTGGCSSQNMDSMRLSYCCGGNCTVVPMEDPSDDLSMNKGVADD